MSETRKQILCVDDEPDIIFRIKSFIERRYPIDVDITMNANEALKMLSAKHYDGVITDVSMPGISGLELTAQIIRLYPQIIVVIITGSGDFEANARAAGVRYFTKPVSMSDFRHMIYDNFGLLPS